MVLRPEDLRASEDSSDEVPELLRVDRPYTSVDHSTVCGRRSVIGRSEWVCIGEQGHSAGRHTFVGVGTSASGVTDAGA